MFDVREGSGTTIMLSVQLLGVLAAAPRDPSQWVGPGLLGFLVIVSLGAATFLLWRNMNKQLRKVRFEERPRPDARQAPRPPSRPGHASQAGGPAPGADELPDQKRDQAHDQAQARKQGGAGSGGDADGAAG
jgi:hypothetical protein